MDDWQPIETAPKDGSPLLLFDRQRLDGDAHPTGAVEGHWCDDYGWQAAVWSMVSDLFLTKKIHPTHWMPLPEPPLTSTESEA